MQGNVSNTAMYQRRCANYIYVVPEGLRELMSDISREVLREQPEDLCCFIADFLDALMITRENARVATKAISSVADSGEVIADLLERTSMTLQQANKTCAIIQRAFRKHMRHRATRHEPVEQDEILEKIMKKTGIDYELAEKAVAVIQRAYRNFRKRKMREMRRDIVDWRAAYRKTMELYRKSGVTQAELERAATLIKAAYKGYYTRRVVRQMIEDSKRLTPGEDAYLADRSGLLSEVERRDSWLVRDGRESIKVIAAMIIQRAWRDYQARKIDQLLAAGISQKSGLKMVKTVSMLRAPEPSHAEISEYGYEEEEEYMEPDEFETMCDQIQYGAYLRGIIPVTEQSSASQFEEDRLSPLHTDRTSTENENENEEY